MWRHFDEPELRLASPESRRTQSPPRSRGARNAAGGCRWPTGGAASRAAPPHERPAPARAPAHLSHRCGPFRAA
jgi:hypothetical protein